ncbi:BTAD domain-containing putative transcriptional regulator [Trujillonella endophytica]|uniref:Transcriptional regulatory protein, C terminal n=1 Tax=Trujillonella endophytica TaxID=673521 RepID=A0A1H8R1G3_9ACTN|nr:BTAD domain-containing putative transcriptional regulator [Trujillella endophytica]SEO59733.1 Transcriptional regulatory protein, C terminal [Trujillella endophytica]
MVYGVLGAVEARLSADAPPLDLGSPLQRVLLGLLLTEPGRSVSLDRIVDALWADAPPADPDASVQTYVSRLRRVLGRVVERTPAGYRLVAEAGDVDAGRFSASAASAGRRLAGGDAAGALADADEALSLWRGPVALEDAGDRPFAAAARDRLEELQRTCREDRTAALLALGRAAEAVPEAEALVASSPLAERPWVLLVDALAAAGRTADALARYAQARRLLDEELGLAPGPALEAAQARALRGPVAVAAAPSPPPALVGRDREFGLLRDLVAGLPRTGPRFALVDGEPGIGKTRLLAEVAAAARASGARVAVGRCHEDDDAPALWPFLQVTGALGGGAGAEGGAAGGAFAAFEAVLSTLVAASSRAPVVVVVDDLHWADPASLRLLGFLAVELQHGPVAVLGTCRTGVRDPGLARVRAALARTPGFTQLTLGPLEPAATAALVAGVVGSDAAGEVHERSGGNPFFATELARVLSGDGSGPVPPGVRDVVERRLAGLPEPAREVLTLAAVAGQRFAVSLLQRADGAAAPDDLADALDAAESADLVRPAGPGELAFAHALVRETLLEGTPPLRRARLHARLAAALPAGAAPFERAHHLVAGRPFTDAEATVAACSAAAERAAHDHAHESAARWWERALEVLDAEGDRPELRSELLLRAGTTMARAGSWAEAQRLLSGVIDAALARGDTGTAATAADQLQGIGGLWFPVTYGVYPAELVGRLEALLAAVGEVDGPARVRTLAALAVVVHYGPDRSRGLRAAEEAVAAARRTGRVDLLRTALVARLGACWLPGHEDRLIANATELLEVTPAEELPEVAMLALVRRAVARMGLGDVDGDAADLAAAWELARRHDLPLVHAQLVSMQAARAMLFGDLETAEELVDRTFALVQRTQLYTQSWQDLVMRSFIWIDRGCLAQRLPEAAAGVDTSGGAGSGTLLTAIALLEAGMAAEAAAEMARVDGWAPFPMQWDWLALTCWQAYAAAELAATPVGIDPAVPAAIADRLLPFADHLAVQGGIGAQGPVALLLGRAEAAAGRLDDAERHLRQAVAVSARSGLRPSEARARLALASLLARRGDVAGVSAEARAALALAEEVGMVRVADEVRRLDPR